MIDPIDIVSQSDLVNALDRLRRHGALGRGKSRLSLDDLARSSRIPRSTVHSYVSGKTLPPPDALDALLIALGVSGPALGQWAAALERVSQSELTAPAAPTPVLLPRCPGKLWGRDALLHRITVEFDRACGQGPVVLLTGMPGVGKSAVAATWARREQHRFRDGIIHIDARGFAPFEPLAEATIRTRVLGALGFPGYQLPRDPDALADFYGVQVGSRRVLIILDNVASASLASSLVVSSPSVGTIVTSRDRLSSFVVQRGALALRVTPIATADATDWLAEAAPHTPPDVVQRVVRRCAGLPLALQLVVEQILSGGDIRALPSSSSDAIEVPGMALNDVLGWSLRTLSDAHQSAFRRLGHIPGPRLGSPIAEAVLNLSTDETTDVLSRLCGVGLIDHQRTSWSRHDLVTEFAREVASDPAFVEEAAETQARLHRWVLSALRAAAPQAESLGEWNLPQCSHAQAAEAWSDVLAHEDAVIALITQALDGGSTERAALYAHLLAAGAEVHDSPVRLAPLLHRVVRAAERSDRVDLIVVLLLRIGTIEHIRGNVSESLAVRARIEELTRTSDPLGVRVENLSRMSVLHCMLDQTGEAEHLLDRAQHHTAGAAQRGLAALELAHGILCLTTHHDREADRHFERAVLRDDSGCLTPYSVTALLNLAGSAVHEGRLEDARALIDQVTSDPQHKRDRRLHLQTLVMSGNIERAAGQSVRSIDTLHEALDLADQQRDFYLTMRIMIQLGRNHVALGHDDEAIDAYRRALHLAREHDHGFDEVCAGIELVPVLLRQGFTNLAASLLRDLAPVVAAHGSARAQATYQSLIGDVIDHRSCPGSSSFVQA